MKNQGIVMSIIFSLLLDNMNFLEHSSLMESMVDLPESLSEVSEVNSSFYINWLPTSEMPSETKASFYVNRLTTSEKESDEKEYGKKEASKDPVDFKKFFDELDMRKSFYFSAQESAKFDPTIFGTLVESDNDPLFDSLGL